MHWQADPVALQVGGFALRWYPLLAVCAFLSAYQLMRWCYARDGYPLQSIDRLIVPMVAGALLGARLVHCLGFEPEHYLRNPIEILDMRQGGVSLHGALLVMLPLFVWLHRTGHPGLLAALDRGTLAAAFGLALIRIGNLFNSELVGISTGLPWGVVFDRIDQVARHPVALYEAIAFLGEFGLLLGFYLRGWSARRDGLLFVTGIGAFALVRLALDPLRAFESPSRLPFGTTGQWFTLIVLLMAGGTVWRGRRPARVSA